MTNKQCKKCGEVKATEDFAVTPQGNPAGSCKECRRKYFREQYRNSPERQEKVKQHVKRSRREVITENVGKMLSYLEAHPCVDCGESNPVVLEFDHVRGEKKWAVSRIVHVPHKWETIKEEIDKCDVRCANCHRLRTAEVRGWYSWHPDYGPKTAVWCKSSTRQ